MCAPVYDHRCKGCALAGDSDKRQLAVIGADGWLSLKKASRLTGADLTELKGLIRSGKLRAYTVTRGGKQRFRVNRDGLAAAGLLRENEPGQRQATVDVTALIREQNQRIANLEDQRAVLSGQLGAALERIRTLDQRVAALEAPHAPEPAEDRLVSERVGSHQPDTSLRALIKTLPIPGSGRWRRDAAGS
jgi:hypothetical protein